MVKWKSNTGFVRLINKQWQAVFSADVMTDVIDWKAQVLLMALTMSLFCSGVPVIYECVSVKETASRRAQYREAETNTAQWNSFSHLSHCDMSECVECIFCQFFVILLKLSVPMWETPQGAGLNCRSAVLSSRVRRTRDRARSADPPSPSLPGKVPIQTRERQSREARIAPPQPAPLLLPPLYPSFLPDV